MSTQRAQGDTGDTRTRTSVAVAVGITYGGLTHNSIGVSVTYTGCTPRVSENLAYKAFNNFSRSARLRVLRIPLGVFTCGGVLAMTVVAKEDEGVTVVTATKGDVLVATGAEEVEAQVSLLERALQLSK